MIQRYLVYLDKELIELGSIEMDDMLWYLAQQIEEDEISLENIIGEKKKFKINREEKLLQRRGIKGFLKYYNTGYIVVEVIDSVNWKLLENKKTEKKELEKFDLSVESQQRGLSVINEMQEFKNEDAKWFELYWRAREFSVNVDSERLICLPYIRDLKLFEYQIKTVKTVINLFKGRVLLCDEVGLGKTIEAGFTLSEYIVRGLVKKVLILVPPSLVDQWYFEMQKKFNQDFIRYDDPKFKNMGTKAWGHYNKVIAAISTAKLKANREHIEKIQYDLIIVDEAHHLKNRNTVAWKFVNSLNKKYIFLLTATPVQNNLEELYNLITLLRPGHLKTYSYFKKNYIGDKEGIEAKNVKQLRELLRNVMIRNKRSDVDIEFTKRKAVTYTLRFSDEQRNLYNQISNWIKEQYIKGHSVFTRFTLKKLQEQMGSTFFAGQKTLEKLYENDKLNSYEKEKIKLFLKQVSYIADNEAEKNVKVQKTLEILNKCQDKVIIFTKYKTTLILLEKYLKNKGYEPAVFHGGLKRKQKEEQITLFREKSSILLSTEVGGEGRNLQFCNIIINFDLPWNPMAIEQRIGRIHRVGQKKDVYVYNLAAEDTLEYYILELLDRKINMFEMVVGEVDLILGDIEKEETFADQMMEIWA